jgi:predicted secreted hydrolase
MSRRSSWGAWLVVGGVLALSIFGTVWSIWRQRPRAPAPALQVSGLLSGGDTSGFARALSPRSFVFPDDHGPHPDFRSEWWYFTGNLQAGQRRFGYQLTIFRQALAAETPPRASAWATRQAYMAHLAVTDVEGRRFVALERLSRDGLGLAGAQASPFRVWLEDWEMSGLFPIRLQAREPGKVALDLIVGEGRGPVLQGEAGLSRKGPEPGNASYYYSFTRLPTRGRLALGGESFEVTGASWFDREWSTSALGPTLAGWDWLALHLSDGRDLMVYRLRRKDGTAAPESRATLIDAQGATRVFGPGAFSFRETAWWTSPHTGARYPTALVIEIPSADISLETSPLLDDQELLLSLRYWEGAVSAQGRAGGAPLTASGYLELTGYAH